ncbi:Triosephosphate isomerase [Lipomyces tetrasporus]|uniref:Triosephosphate isomerase n=1 Tax=Lipomyces tetrasporus TaxID=54092 RepID=A0AAD7QW65_9ASCO|nr:Triosephosphate isomerase [Lipomyces tetrasporus]KAJ8102346.1 Triosephosphate isomerase [Lipomyces tetrasporus]
MAPPNRTPLIGMSLKMYFTPARTKQYLSSFVSISRAANSFGVTTFLIPDFLSLAAACTALVTTEDRRYTTGVGAQDCFWEDSGAYTGEISPWHLRELGVGYVEIGHAERRRIFHESDDDVAKKAAAAAKHGLIPVVCIGEVDRNESDIDCAVQFSVKQMAAAVRSVPVDSQVVFAYEPVWAIGQPAPAPTAYINAVCAGLRSYLDSDGRKNSARIIYGGSAGPGLFTELDSETVDGMFIGRFGHDPENFEIIVREIASKKFGEKNLGCI